MVRQILTKCLIGVLLLGSACTATLNSSPTNSSKATEPRPTVPINRTAPGSGFREATPQAPLNLSGLFAYAIGDGSIWLMDAATGDAAPMISRSTKEIAQFPTFAPGGNQIVYSVLLFLEDGRVRGDIRTIDLDGGNMRTLLRAAGDEVILFYPRFARDGRLLVTRAENLQTSAERAQLEWYDVRGSGSRQVVKLNARDGDSSPDGSQIAYVRYDVPSGQSSLWLAGADGSDERELVPPETFAGIQNPRFSPDGRWLAFGVHGGALKSLPLVRECCLDAQPTVRVGRANDECAVRALFVCLAQRASAHVAPGAVWRVNLEDGRFQQLTDIYDDSPIPAWSVDSSQLVIQDMSGIRLIDLIRREIYPLFLEAGGSGGFDWSDN